MNAIEEDIEKERSLHNKLESVASAEKVIVLDGNGTDKKTEGILSADSAFWAIIS